MRSTRPTVADLRARKGSDKHTAQMTMLYVETEEEAAAAAAGIDILSIIAPLWTPAMREAAGNCFVQVGLLYSDLVTSEDYLRAGHAALKTGGDCFYCAAGLPTIRSMTDEGLPVIGHIGLIPSKATWTGGFRAVGKTAQSAFKVWQDCLTLQDAGVFAIEMEVVPERVAAEISQRLRVLTFGMGTGSGCDSRYLFADDILGIGTEWF